MSEILKKYREYLEARNFSLVYFNYIRLWLGYCEQSKIDYLNITQEHITNFFNSDKKYSSNTKSNFIKAGRNFYSYLGVEKDNNEWYKIKLIPSERKIPEYITEDELKQCVKYVCSYHSDLMNSDKADALLNFLFYTGLRKGEVLNLKRADIDLNKSMVKVCVPNKGKSERIVLFPSSLKTKLEKYFKIEEEKTNAFNISLAQLNYLPRILGKNLNRNISIHLFRHSNARHLIEKGIPLGIVSKLLGHKNITTTMIYTDPDAAMIERVFREKMGG